MIQLVLDASAVASYVDSSMGVGETLAELGDEEEPAYFAVPALALVEAYRRRWNVPGAIDQLDLLLANPYCVLVPFPAKEWRYLAEMATQLSGRVDLAAALALAEEHEAEVLTSEASKYPEYLQGWLIRVEDGF